MKSSTPISILVMLALTAVVEIAAFSPALNTGSKALSSTSLNAGFFDAVFGPKTAEASHILLKGNNASEQCEKLKIDIYKMAIKNGSVEGGVEPYALMSAVSVHC